VHLTGPAATNDRATWGAKPPRPPPISPFASRVGLLAMLRMPRRGLRRPATGKHVSEMQRALAKQSRKSNLRPAGARCSERGAGPAGALRPLRSQRCYQSTRPMCIVKANVSTEGAHRPHMFGAPPIILSSVSMDSSNEKPAEAWLARS
jgi:hypothetical protein